MSRHLAFLESHLPPVLNRALVTIVAAAEAADVNLFVTASTMRDVLAGVSPRALDLVVEGNAVAFAGSVPGTEMSHDPESTLAAVLRFPSGIEAWLLTACDEKFPKPGGKPKQTPASIHEHLRSRDFSANAIALSLSRASRGLLMDPTNGVADIEAREIRALHSRVFQDRPVRLLSLLRMRMRLGCNVFPRTQTWFEESCTEKNLALVKPGDLLGELRKTAPEPRAVEVLRAWDDAGMLTRLLPMLAGGLWNAEGFTKLIEVRQMIPFGVQLIPDEEALFFWTLTEGLSTKDRAAFLLATEQNKASASGWLNLSKQAGAVEQALSSPTSQRRPSQIYKTLQAAGATIALWLADFGTQKLAVERARNYLTKYLPEAAEAGPDPADIYRHLDTKPKKIVEADDSTDEALPGANEA